MFYNFLSRPSEVQGLSSSACAVFSISDFLMMSVSCVVPLSLSVVRVRGFPKKPPKRAGQFRHGTEPTRLLDLDDLAGSMGCEGHIGIYLSKGGRGGGGG